MSRPHMGTSYHRRSVVTLVLAYATLIRIAKRAAAFPVAKAPVALITGANRGLGLAISEVLSEKGYHVIMASRAETEGRRAVDLLKERGHSASFLKLDVTSRDDIMQAVSYIKRSETHLDLLVNNAGVCIRDVCEGALRTSLEVNALGPMRLTQALLPHLRKKDNGGGRGGIRPCVVCVSSGDGELAYLHAQLSTRLANLESWQEWEAWLAQLCSSPWASERLGQVSPLPWPAYSLSKAALNAASRLLHAEMQNQDTGVAVKTLCPGDVLTDMCDIPEEERAAAPHLLTPLEAARDVVWVAENHDACPSGHFYRARQAIPW